MAVEAWKIGVQIALEGNIMGELGNVIAEFERLESLIGKIAATLGRLSGGFARSEQSAKGLESVGTGVARVWADAAKSMEGAVRAAKSATSVKVPQIGQGAGGRAGGHAASGGHLSHALMNESFGLAGPAEAITHVGREALSAGTEYERPEMAMRNRSDYTKAMEDEFNSQTARMSQEHERVPINVIRDIVASAIRNIGDPAHAYEAAGDLLDYQDISQSASMREGMSPEEAVEHSMERTEAAAKAAELLGRVAKKDRDPKTGKAMLNADGTPMTEFDAGRFSALIRMLESVTSGTQGGVGAEKLLGMVISGGISMQDLSIQGLQNKLAEAQTQNHHKIGTQSQAIFQQFTTGIEKEKNFDAFKNDIKIYDDDVVYTKRNGVTLRGKRKPGDTIDKHVIGHGTDNDMNTNFGGWVEHFLIPRLETMGIKEPLDQAKYIATNMQTGTARREIVEQILMGVLIDKDAKYNFKPQQTGKAGADQLASGAQGAQAALYAQWQNTLTILGTDIIPVLVPMIHDLATELAKFAAYAKENPQTVKYMAEFGAAMVAFDHVCGALLSGGMMVAGLTFFGKALRGLAADVAPFAAGGDAALAIGTLGGGVAVSVVGWLVALAAAVTGLPPALRAAVDGINSLLGITPTQSGSAARGGNHGGAHGPEPYGPPQPTLGQRMQNYLTGGDARTDLEHSLTDLKHSLAAPTHQQLRGGAKHVAYYQPYRPDTQAMQPINIDFKLDGRTIATHNATVMTRALNAPRSGTTGADTMMTPAYPGGGYEL